jgi:hypothetical protein
MELQPWSNAWYRLRHGIEDLQLSRDGFWSAKNRQYGIVTEIATTISLK